MVIGNVVAWSEKLLCQFEMMSRRLDILMEMLLWLLRYFFVDGGGRGCCVVWLGMLVLSWLEMLLFDTCGGTVVEKNEKD